MNGSGVLNLQRQWETGESASRIRGRDKSGVSPSALFAGWPPQQSTGVAFNRESRRCVFKGKDERVASVRVRRIDEKL